MVNAGRTIVAKVDGGKTVFTVDDKPMDEKIQRLLSSFCRLDRPTDPVRNAKAMGTDQRRRVGETWALDAKQMAERYQSVGYQVAAKDLTASMTLAEVLEDGDPPEPYLRVEIETEIRSMLPPKTDRLPEGMTVKSSSSKMHRSTLRPVNPQGLGGSLVEEQTNRRTFTGKSEGVAYTIDQENVSELHARYSNATRGPATRAAAAAGGRE